MKSLRKPSKAELHNLLDRGVTNIIDRAHLEKSLNSGKQLRVKLGFDPTGGKIHIGRAIILRKLRDFQMLGHKVIFIVGDFTARIGDPSDKLSKRPMLSKEQIKKNIKNYKSQVGKIIDFKKAEFSFNSKWLKKLDFEEIGELAESFSIQQMLERRNFSDRVKKGEEISLRELLYPLMQGYDSVAVKADVELGGFDQLFNLHAGRVIQRHYGQKEQDILTCEMLEGTDGRKMSTSWGNVINIVDEPNDMFGKVMAVRDELISKYFLLCTDVPENEIKKIQNDTKAGKLNPRDAKLRLAREIVSIYHGENVAKKAEEEFTKVFSKKELPSKMEQFKLSSPKDLVYILVNSKISPSKSEAWRLIKQGGIKIDNKVIKDPKHQVSDDSVIQAGKRHFLKIFYKK
ncbi:MAG: tyrosine--tRNA ligase [Parcubacteria group bacterium CG1_02_42_13]|uniref:Tyrosine--tRNA ligase n=1 Tax=Candidatus Colwellbacteria bacterium CG23_combo_of_CG06-09_8_20_14_all_42_19 TaxID=1974541 RepID=A0A2H0AMD7_9BACT|nr:MAG: tyrosine--tRNA ligase [Parcubacteria group bacterium CG1_02_42_13]PIP46579.1 MAG: tyrosine--tRNA ligase [Candidatus Colwellbacteria bacterium CG23_combo_of_CG06-09_8_20_14_all_42_19]